jgi:hypothetical protein
VGPPQTRRSGGVGRHRDRVDIGPDVVDLAVIPTGAVRLGQMQQRDVVGRGEHLHVTADPVTDLGEQRR